MPPNIITESHIEEIAIEFLEKESYNYLYAPIIAPLPEGNGERQRYSDVVLIDRLRTTLIKVNPKVPKEAIEEAIKKVLRIESQNLISICNSLLPKLMSGKIRVPIKTPA